MLPSTSCRIQATLLNLKASRKKQTEDDHCDRLREEGYHEFGRNVLNHFSHLKLKSIIFKREHDPSCRNRGTWRNNGGWKD